MYYSSTNTAVAVFELLPSLLPPITCVKPNPDAVPGFRMGISSENGPLFSVGGRPENNTENGSVKNRYFRIYEDSQTGFAIRKRSFSASDTLQQLGMA